MSSDDAYADAELELAELTGLSGAEASTPPPPPALVESLVRVALPPSPNHLMQF